MRLSIIILKNCFILQKLQMTSNPKNTANEKLDLIEFRLKNSFSKIKEEIDSFKKSKPEVKSNSKDFEKINDQIDKLSKNLQEIQKASIEENKQAKKDFQKIVEELSRKPQKEQLIENIRLQRRIEELKQRSMEIQNEQSRRVLISDERKGLF